MLISRIKMSVTDYMRLGLENYIALKYVILSIDKNP